MSRFRTIEVSEPQYEHDHLRHVTIKSSALKGRGDITLFVPPDISGLKNVSCAILLHGVYGSHWAWALNGGAHKTALSLIDSGAIQPLVLAMPSDGLWGDGSGYVSHAHDFDAWIMSDVVDCVREVVPPTVGGPLFISGLSMGGYGALRLGGKYAAKLRGISAHSSITHFEQMKQFVIEPLESYGHMVEREKSAAHWLMQAGVALPALRFDCGTSDPLIEPNRALHKTLLDAGVKHEYQEFSGGHSWDYWREHLADTLRFFERCR